MIKSDEGGIGVAITQWNHSLKTQQLLSTLVHSDSISSIVICDNGSRQEEYQATLDYLNKFLQPLNSDEESLVTVFRNQNNSGFSTGTNIAVSNLLEKEVEWIWLLNSDTQVSLDNIQKVASLIENNKAGIYGISIIEKPIGKFTGFYRYNFLTTRHMPVISSNEFDVYDESSIYCSGASMLVHRNVFEKVGLLCEDTFLYFEELDFMYRARSEGFDQFHLQGPNLHHLGAGSSGDMNKVKIYNETWSLINFYMHYKKVMVLWILLIRMPIKILVLVLKSKSELISIMLSAIIDFYTKKHKFLKKANILESKYFGRG